MILVDTSVWVDYFNGVENPQTDQLDAALINDDVVIGDLIYLEILQGFRSDSDFKQAKEMLNALEQYQMFGVGMADKCAENYRKLRKNGITIRKTADVIIATFCIDQKIPLLFIDRDFQPFVDRLGLISASDLN